MHISEVRPCDACRAPVKTIVYAITVQALVHTTGEEMLKPVGASIDLQICARCSCGLTTHALPLAMENRTQVLDRKRQKMTGPENVNPAPTGPRPMQPVTPPPPPHCCK